MEITEIYSYYINSYKVSIDSRNVDKGSIFFALQGNNVNANEFAKSAIEKGASLALVYEKKYEDKSNNIIYQENTLQILQELASYHRKKLSIPIIAITGSNGKTTTKELIAQVLEKKFCTLFTQGNLNNHIGVPLTLLSIEPKHEIAVIEMGANHQKEIEFLCTICLPDFGYITNFGKAHLEGFGGIEGVIKGKSELYIYLKAHHKTILINADDLLQQSLTKDSKTISFGSKNSDYNIEIAVTKFQFAEIIYKNCIITSNLTGKYNGINMAAALSFGLYFGVELNDIKNAIENYFPTNHRSQVVEKNGKTIIIDAYNANPSSMELSLENFSNYKGNKIAILGDMFELGNESSSEHQKIIQIAEDMEINQLHFIGNEFYQHQNNTSNFYKSREEFIDYLAKNPLQNAIILIKGSRGMALEKLLDWL